MSDPVTLVRWRRADTDPPEEHFDAGEAMSVLRVRSDGIVVLAYYVEDDGWYPIYNGTERLDDLTDDWAHSPQPPGDDAPTMGDLRLALAWGEGAYKRHIERRPRHFNPHIEAELQDEEPAKLKAFARLRAALDAFKDAEGDQT